MAVDLAIDLPLDLPAGLAVDRPGPARGDPLPDAIDRALTLAGRGQVAQASAGLGEALRHRQAVPGALEQAVRELLEGAELMMAGHYESALRQALPALELLERSPLAPRMGWACSAVGYCLGALGDPARGLEWTARAVALGERSEERLDALKAYSDQGSLLTMLQQHEQARQSLQRALFIARELSLPQAQADCLNDMALSGLEVLRDNGNSLDDDTYGRQALQVLALAEEASEIAGKSGLRGALAWAHHHRARALLLLGDLPMAAAALDDGEALSREYPPVRIESLQTRALLAQAQGDLALARHYLLQALNCCSDTRHAQAEARVLQHLVGLEHASGRLQEAMQWADRRYRAMEALYQKRVRLAVRAAEVFVEAERARLDVQRARERQRQLEKISSDWQDVAQRDSLTQAFNRRGLQVQGAAHFGSGHVLAVAMLDLEGFRRINDLHGHAAGDAVLVRLAALLHSACRPEDALVRLGGVSFVLLMPGLAAEAALAACERLRERLADEPWQALAPGVPLTPSIGLALRDEQLSLDELLADADLACGTARAAGGGRVVLYRPAQRPEAPGAAAFRAFTSGPSRAPGGVPPSA